VRAALAIALVLAGGCGKKKDAGPTEGSGAAPTRGTSGTSGTKGSATSGSGAGAESPPAGPGISITSSINPEIAGTYDKAFAKLGNADEATTIVFVRGCPALVCTDNVFELESIAVKCPKAYLATAALAAKSPKPGDHMADVVVAGPAEKSSTITLAQVDLTLTAIGQDGVAGSAAQSTTESKVSGSFNAEICGRM